MQANQSLEFKRAELARQIAQEMKLDPTDAFRDIQETEHYAEALRNMCAAQLAIKRGHEAPLLHLRRPGVGRHAHSIAKIAVKPEPLWSDDEEVRRPGDYS